MKMSEAYECQNYKMNITGNNRTYTIENRQQTVFVLGNHNKIVFSNAQVDATINGNNNQFMINSSMVQLNINGNNNVLAITSSQVQYTVNGSNNHFNSSPDSQILLVYCNGNNNTTPSQTNQSNNNRNSANRNNQNNYNYRQLYQFNNQPNSQHYSWNNPGYHLNQPYNNQTYFNYYQPQYPYYSQHIWQAWGNNFMNNTQRAMGRIQNNINNRRRANQHRQFQFNQRNGRQFNQSQEPKLSEEQIDLLPRSKHTGKEGKCTICLSQIQQGQEETFLMCFHSFHWECIHAWLKKSTKCPLCQYDVSENLHVNYAN